MLKKRRNVGASTLNPEIHRVAGNQLRLVHLLQNVELEARNDVRQKEIRRRSEFFGNHRTKMRKNAEVRLECLGGIQIVAIPPAPTERRSLGPFETAEIDAALLQWIQFRHRIIGSDDPDHAHLGEMACRCGEESRGSAE